ncbi:alpha/beta hydrolase-fold protein [Oceanisphaera sp. IT1-181]
MAQKPTCDKRSISGHSTGGHCALVLTLHNLERFKPVSAFSPIGNSVNLL